MSSRRLVVAALMASVGLAAWVSAQPGQPEQPGEGRPASAQPGGRPPGPGPDRRADGQPESLERLMKTMGRGLRTLKRQIEDPARRAENLQILGDMERAAVVAKGMKPHELPPGDEAALLDEYRSRQLDVLDLMIRAERSLLKGDAADAAKALGELESLRDNAHKKFAPDEDDHDRPPGRDNAPARK